MLARSIALSLLSLSVALGQTATGKLGMVSAAHPLAADAGIEILKKGGNAFDAAVAIAATLNVVEPENSGMGGYGLILIYDAAKRQTRVLNASGRIPKGADPEVFRRDPKARRGAKTIAPPVNVRAWEQLSKGYGKLPWKSLFDTAIRHAGSGYTLLRDIPKDAFQAFPPHAQAFYGSNGVALKKGDSLVQKDLAKSLRMVADQGPDALHGGELGKAIAAELTRAGAFVTFDDLKNSAPEWYEPISVDYRGYQVMTASPPANSFTALIRLGILSQWDLKALDENERWHRLAEVTKHGEWCRLRYAGDPDVARPPLDRLLSKTYFAEQARRITAKAEPFAAPGVTGSEGRQTTHFAVADQWGNVVTATQTLGTGFGSKVMAPGTGIWLNDSLSFSTFEPAGNPMDVHPGRRKLNSNVPVIVLKDGKPVIALGASGGHTIPQTVPLALVEMIDLGKDIGQALAAPRIAFVSGRNALSVEKSLPESVQKDLAARGHKLRVDDFSRLQGLTMQWDRAGKVREFQGAADPRGVGQAKGY